MPFIEVRNLTVQFPYQDHPAVNQVSFSLERDERVLLLGPSGCGKSTLLLSLVGLIPRSVEAQVSGQVLLEGRQPQVMPSYEVSRRLGYLFQEPENQFCLLYPLDEIAFGLENLALPPDEMDGRIKTALDSVRLWPIDNSQHTDQMSGGQQQRLALAACLALDAQLLILDEPTSNLDPSGRRALVESAALAAKAGKGLLVVEHNLDQWFPLLDRLIILGPGGTLFDDGPPADLFPRWGRYLEEIGVWRPRAVSVATVLQQEGYECTPLPLNAATLRNLPIPRSALTRALERTNQPSATPAGRMLGPPAVEFHRLTAGYPGGPEVLHDISLAISRGDFWALAGPNGSGKSTLTRILIGMVKPRSGTVSLFGNEIRKLGPKSIAKLVGYVFQNPEHQFVTDSVWQELAYSLRGQKQDKGDCLDSINNALEFFGLAHLKACNPFTLSGGEKRRLSAAAMLAGSQPLLVLDEPTFGQDQRSAGQLMDRIADINRQGTTILMVSHDLDLVDAYANKVALLYEGRLVYAGPTADLWEQPDLLEKCGLEAPFRLQCLGTTY